MLFRACFPCACLLLLATPLWAEHASTGASAAKARKDAGSYEHQVVPVLEKYCYGCHGRGKKKGGVALDLYTEETAAAVDQKTWEKVLQNLRTHVMPPDNKPQPSLKEAAQVTG